jgi:hypothetical protein
MDSLYSVVVRLGMDSTGFGAGASLATGLLQKLEQQALASGTAAAGLGKSLAMIGGGVALLTAGFAGLHVLSSWAKDAGVMQDALVQVGIAAGGTRAQLAALYSQSFAVANVTQYSGQDVLAMEQLMARQGFRDLTGKKTQRQVIGEAIPQFAQSAEIIQHFNKVGYEQTVTAFTSLSHMFGAFSGAALAANVAHATGAAVVSHLNPSQLVNTVRYLTPALKSGQLSSVDAIALAALGNETGLTMGKGGSNIGALLRSLAPTGAAKHDRALLEIEKLAGGDFWQHGRALPLPQELGLLNKFYDSAKGPKAQISPEMANYLAKNAFLVQGSQAAAVLANDASIKQFAAIRAQILTWTPAKEKEAQGELNMTLPGQMATLSGNLGSIRSLLGAQLLPAIGPILHGFVELTSSVVNLLRLHPGIAQFVVTFVAVSTAAALIAGPVLIAAGAFGILSAAGVLGTISFGPFILIALAVIGAVAGVTMAIQHWGDIMRWARDHMVLLHNAVFALSVLVPPLGFAIGAGVLIFQHWHEITHAVGDALGALGTVIAPYVALLTPIVQLAGQLIGAFGQWISTTDLLKASMSQLTAPFVALGGMIHEVQVGLGNLVGAYSKLPAPLRAIIATGAQGAALSLLHNIPLVGGLFGQGGGGGAASGGASARSMTIRHTTHAAAIHLATHATHHNAVVHNHHAAAAIHQVTHATHHSAVVHNRHTATTAHHTTTATATARGGDTHIHMHPGAAAIHIHPGPTHDHKKIADEAAKAAGDHLGHHIANTLRTSGVLPSTTRPTLHQLGMS